MALLDCHECGKPVSTEAKSCPSCGAKPKKVKKSGNLLKILVIGGIVVAAASSLAPSSNDPCNNEMTNAKVYGAAKRAIDARLRAPTSAEYSSLGDTRITKIASSKPGECTFTIDMRVDAQNAFGAKLRTQYQVTVNGTAAGDWSVAKISN